MVGRGKWLLSVAVIGAMACAEDARKDQRIADLEAEVAACRAQLAEAEAETAASASVQPRPPAPRTTPTSTPSSRRGRDDLGF